MTMGWSSHRPNRAHLFQSTDHLIRGQYAFSHKSSGISPTRGWVLAGTPVSDGCPCTVLAPDGLRRHINPSADYAMNPRSVAV